MKYPDGTLLKYLGTRGDRCFKIGTTYKVFKSKEVSGCYFIPQITRLPDGWSDEFIEDISQFILITPDWQERIERLKKNEV